MRLTALKDRIMNNKPIYFQEKMVSIICIYDIFGLVDIKEIGNEDICVVDILTLSDIPYSEKSICINKLLAGMR
ncbi:hypothetical protein [Clostridium botulinum]